MVARLMRLVWGANRCIASKLLLVALLLVALLPSAAFACTPAIGVDREAFYRMIALPGRLASAVSLLAAIAWLVVSRAPTARRSAILIALAIVNPGWWIWDIGDCGTSAFLVGGAMALLSLVLLGAGLRRRNALRKAAHRAACV